MTDTIVIFAGPTVSAAQIRDILPDAVCLPPVAQGDVIRALREYKPRVIGIVDGYFGNVPAVWHKEIMFAMVNEAHVLGAASMGALRAAELHNFGMDGVGQVFESFKSGLLQDDDEVAVMHGPEDSGYMNLSEAMVNIRATIADARASGVITQIEHDAMIDYAKSLHFGDRNYNSLPANEKFKAWLKLGRRDIKKEDALLMLDRIAQMRRAGIMPKKVGYELAQTASLLKTREQVRR